MQTLKKNILSIYGNEGEIWLNQLPQYVEQIAELWNLKHLKQLPNLSFNYVLSGFQNKLPVILKISFDQDALNREANALKSFHQHGAVSVLNHSEHALLLQKAMPGLLLKQLPNQKGIKIACQVIEKLRQVSFPIQSHFPHIKDLLSALDNKWDLPIEYLNKARILRDQLLAKNIEKEILIHGDLHRENILQHHEEWLMIDPKGVIGYPINEIWACVENLEYDLKYLANYFNYPFQDVVRWYYVHLMLAACWQKEDCLDANLFLNLAKLVEPLIRL